MQRILIHIKSRSLCWMCPSAPRVCSEPGGQKPELSLSLDLIWDICMLPVWITLRTFILPIPKYEATVSHPLTTCAAKRLGTREQFLMADKSISMELRWRSGDSMNIGLLPRRPACLKCIRSTKMLVSSATITHTPLFATWRDATCEYRMTNENHSKTWLLWYCSLC